MKISGIYKITNTVTGDFYIGSSKDVKHRLAVHKCQSTWKKCPNNQLYLDMKKYGVENFVFEILEEVEEEQLKEREQQFIETLKPTYNSNRANGLDIERYKEWQEEYRKTDKCKKYNKEYQKEYRQSEKGKKYNKEYRQSEKGKKYQKEYQKEYKKEYNNQLCSYNGETLTLSALRMRFKRQGIDHPTAEAKKYLLNKSKDNIQE